MTPTSTEALAAEWQKKATAEASRRNSAYDHYGMGNTPESVDPLGAKMATELRRLAAVEAENDNLSGMAGCMDMLRRDLIEAGVIESSVAPMFMTEAILSALQKANDDRDKFASESAQHFIRGREWAERAGQMEAERDALRAALELMTDAFLDTEGNHGPEQQEAMSAAFAAMKGTQ